MQKLETLTAPSEAQILGVLERDGGVIVSDYIDPARIAQLRTDYMRAIDAQPWANSFDGVPSDFFGLKTKRLHGVFQHSLEAAACFRHPLALSLARTLLGEHISLSTGELMAIGPGERRQALHRDGDSWFRAQIDRDVLFSVNISLTDFRRENGATVVVPGSHLAAPTREPTEGEFAYAEMTAGSALLYRGRTLHGGGANATDETRIGLYFGYVPAWIRPLENIAITMPQSAIDELDDELRLLLGVPAQGFIAVV